MGFHPEGAGATRAWWLEPCIQGVSSRWRILWKKGANLEKQGWQVQNLFHLTGYRGLHLL